MTCQSCGRKPQTDGTPTHYIGCVPPKTEAERERTRESECVKNGCTNPRAVSRGPRPTKYCDEHKTGSK